jgi:hypothetical protein
LEPKAPPLLRKRTAATFAAPGLLLPTLAISLVFLGLPGMTAAAQPQPDPAPQAPAVAPDPAPDATNAAPPQQSAPSPPVQVAPQAPADTEAPATAAPPAPTATPSTATPRQASPKPASPKPKAESKPARVHRETPQPRPERVAGPADPSLLMRVDSFLPGVQGDEDSPSHLVLLAAAALLALLLASGSLLSVATRVWPGQLR